MNNSVDIETRRPMKTRFCTFYERAQLLIGLSVPIVIVIYTFVQYNNEQAIAEKNRQQDLAILNETRIKDLELAADVRAHDLSMADDQQKEDLLIKYQYFVANLLTNTGKLSDKNSHAVYFKTLVTLSRLNAARKISLIQSLYSINLIQRHGESPVIPLASADLANINFSVVTEFPCIAFEGALLNNASFRHANIDRASFKKAKLSHADFSYTISPNKQRNCNDNDHEDGIVFREAYMYRTKFINTSYISAYFGQVAMANEANFYGFKCVSCDFSDVSLIRANFTEASIQAGKLDSTTFSRANMTEACLHKSYFQTVELSDTIMTNVNGTEAEFNKCVFSGAYLVNSSFNQVKIIQSSMLKVNLTDTDLSKSNLTKVIFISADLHYVNM